MRITENDIKRMVMESVSKILETRGFVKPDGNSMTGGAWDSRSETTKTVNVDIRSILDNAVYNHEIELSEDDADILFRGLENEYPIEVSYSSSYDDSTGYGSRFSPKVNISKVTLSPQLLSYFEQLPIEDTIKTSVISFLSDADTYGFDSEDVSAKEDYEDDYFDED